MDIPEQWNHYQCADYFNSPWASNGYFDEQSQYLYIRPAQEVVEDSTQQFLIIGGPGVDGIEWGYRRGEPGLWARYPIDGEFAWLALTVETLIQGWIAGTITV